MKSQSSRRAINEGEKTMKLYGSINNRFEENKMFTDEIKVGTGMTEYHWSDRDAYEVIAVKDQKHVTVREYDHKLKGGAFSNDWELISNPDNPVKEMVKRGDYWYATRTITADEFDLDDNRVRFDLVMAGFDPERIRTKGKQTIYRKMNVSFGIADYYFDYEF